jgi:hypothetical protein
VQMQKGYRTGKQSGLIVSCSFDINTAKLHRIPNGNSQELLKGRKTQIPCFPLFNASPIFLYLRTFPLKAYVL